MMLSKWLKGRYPNLSVFVGDDFLKNCLSSAEKFLATNPSNDAIFKFLDEKSCHTRFKNMTLRACLNIEPEENPIPKMELDLLEESVRILFEKFPDKKRLNHLAKKLRNPTQMWQGMHEIYVAGRLCPISSKIKFEVKNTDTPGKNYNFDILAKIEGDDINIEITTRSDDFPPLDGKDHYRAIVPPAFCDDSGFEIAKNGSSHDKNPESDDLRRKLMKKATQQLPRNGMNIIVLGYKATACIEWYIANALYGDYPLLSGKDGKFNLARVENELFSEKDFSHISAVVWIRPYSKDGKIYLNPKADKELPLAIQQKLE